MPVRTLFFQRHSPSVYGCHEPAPYENMVVQDGTSGTKDVAVKMWRLTPIGFLAHALGHYPLNPSSRNFSTRQGRRGWC